MELEFNRVKIPCLRTVTNRVQRLEQSQDVRLTDGMPDIGRILLAYGQPLIRSKEWRSESMSVSGGVMAWVLYEPEDEGPVQWIETWIPFQMKWDFPDSERDGTMRFETALKTIDARSTSARKILVRAEVDVKGCACVADGIEYCECAEIPEDIFIRKQKYPVLLPMEAGEKAINLEEEVSLPAAAETLEKIVCYTLRQELTETKIVSDKAVFRGYCVLHLLYTGQDERLHVTNVDIPFSQYAQLDKEYGQEAQLDVRITMTDMEVTDSGSGKLIVRIGLIAQYTVSDMKHIEIPMDAYSVKKAVKPEIINFVLPSVLDKIDRTVSLEHAVAGQSERIVDTILLAEYPEWKNEDGHTSVICKGNISTLIYGQDGRLAVVSSPWNESVLIPTSDLAQVDMAFSVSGNPQSTQGVDEIMQRGSLCLEYTAFGGEGLPMLSKIEIGEDVTANPDRPSLILRRGDTGSLWDIAKEAGSTVALIREANGIEQEPEGDKMLLIPVIT